ncbi:MAG: hypothetical protein HC849_07485 [Oscillatoriales cyanobacterium RU_3_3]|nr:hypothetical protein [Oscillatoriales cyanobacterium RU_3_3]
MQYVSSLCAPQALPKTLLALAYVALLRFEQSVRGCDLPSTDEFLLCFEEPPDTQPRLETDLPQL